MKIIGEEHQILGDFLYCETHEIWNPSAKNPLIPFWRSRGKARGHEKFVKKFRGVLQS